MKNQTQYSFHKQVFTALLSLLSMVGQAQQVEWPAGKKAALSLSFDDARLSNVDVGLPLFSEEDVQVTFYVVPSAMKERLQGWKDLVAAGHELGNHTLLHPCSGNFAWARDKALENYNLTSMRTELEEASVQIEALTGVKPVSFAYSCGQTYVGRGKETQSYVPLIADLFQSGRGWMDEVPNDPVFVDMAQLQGIEMDGKDFENEIKPILESAVKNGDWVVLAGHEIGEDGRQTTRVDMLKELIAYVKKPENGIWLAPVGEIAEHVEKERARIRSALSESLSLAASFDKGAAADFARGESSLYTASAYDELTSQKKGLQYDAAKIVEDQGRYGSALAFPKKEKAVAYYQAAENVTYDRKDWSGSISLWLSVDPNTELAPGYTDPIQITDVGYNDAALWVDFSDKNPRSFRMGVYGDLAVWNPKNISPDKNPVFNERLLPATDLPFAKGVWTHVVVTFDHLNGKNATANFYINGKHQGERRIEEPFSWDLAKAKIFLGLNFVGLIDEVALFDRPLSNREVQILYHLPGGLNTLLTGKK